MQNTDAKSPAFLIACLAGRIFGNPDLICVESNYGLKIVFLGRKDKRLLDKRLTVEIDE
ncbi:hypothetical protein [Mucilaginibacter sp. SP1R1]|uniref:hypothetical protein n=1 Tax=Mucilaginibacter sp. SP1R1 TaxID=2723091 RepID=UPI0016160B35|nr:hypothetical protein [Mucilaginibacter sp. SP1R1]MBB6149714.1 hypothetical protein [Mucilaginibacter sp. SP1R1]